MSTEGRWDCDERRNKVKINIQRAVFLNLFFVGLIYFYNIVPYVGKGCVLDLVVHFNYREINPLNT